MIEAPGFSCYLIRRSDNEVHKEMQRIQWSWCDCVTMMLQCTHEHVDVSDMVRYGCDVIVLNVCKNGMSKTQVALARFEFELTPFNCMSIIRLVFLSWPAWNRSRFLAQVLWCGCDGGQRHHYHLRNIKGTGTFARWMWNEMSGIDMFFWPFIESVDSTYLFGMSFFFVSLAKLRTGPAKISKLLQYVMSPCLLNLLVSENRPLKRRTSIFVVPSSYLIEWLLVCFDILCSRINRSLVVCLLLIWSNCTEWWVLWNLA